MPRHEPPTPERLEHEIEKFQNEFVPQLHVWLSSLEGRQFESKGQAHAEIGRIVTLVRRAGRKLMYDGQPVTLTIVDAPRQRHLKIHVHGRKDGAGIVLRASSKLPAFSTAPAN